MTAPTYAWLRIGHFVDAADRSGPAIDADTNPGRRLQTILLHHSEITEVRKLTRHLPQDRRFRR
ncbi:hypothetical protein CKO28_02960 [Rhodovibrio sodomensis]|uniref:Uncharacterized protein n=1 Tax=Rhodovibrio sodomensis TaxID=1088 RepID=A0ABS1D9B1_9PROT|nr:hypothetical protein [Rhodovibrio sodomensis]MBK1667003.1 hypothetical protein [Rhodovibrio sodomensis]